MKIEEVWSLFACRTVVLLRLVKNGYIYIFFFRIKPLVLSEEIVQYGYGIQIEILHTIRLKIYAL